MLDQELKLKIRDLWNRFWAGGIANPLTAIEQISYLLFFERLEKLDERRAARAAREGKGHVSIFSGCPQCRWSSFKLLKPDEMMTLMQGQAFELIKSPDGDDTFSQAMSGAVFSIPKASLLHDSVRIIDSLHLSELDTDTQGDIYEELLSELNLSGKNGQFRTPRHIISTMVALVQPERNWRICDPAAGTGGFLVAADRFIRRSSPSGLPSEIPSHNLVGYDFDTTMVRLGLMNMLLHGISDPQLRYQDTLSKSFPVKAEYDLVLANPPFTGSVDASDINRTSLTLNTTRTELLFLELSLGLLKPKGRFAIIVPEGVLFGASTAQKDLRQRLVDVNTLNAVVSLPSGCFRPYSNVKTAILLGRKGGSSTRVWFLEVTGDGFTLDDRRRSAPADDNLRLVPDAVAALDGGRLDGGDASELQEFLTERCWFATATEIAASGYLLTGGRYRPSGPATTAQPDPRELIDQIEQLNLDIGRRLDRIKLLVGTGKDAL